MHASPVFRVLVHLHPSKKRDGCPLTAVTDHELRLQDQEQTFLFTLKHGRHVTSVDRCSQSLIALLDRVQQGYNGCIVLLNSRRGSSNRFLPEVWEPLLARLTKVAAAGVECSMTHIGLSDDHLIDLYDQSIVQDLQQGLERNRRPWVNEMTVREEMRRACANDRPTALSVWMTPRSTHTSGRLDIIDLHCPPAVAPSAHAYPFSGSVTRFVNMLSNVTRHQVPVDVQQDHGPLFQWLRPTFVGQAEGLMLVDMDTLIKRPQVPAALLQLTMAQALDNLHYDPQKQLTLPIYKLSAPNDQRDNESLSTATTDMLDQRSIQQKTIGEVVQEIKTYQDKIEQQKLTIRTLQTEVANAMAREAALLRDRDNDVAIKDLMAELASVKSHNHTLLESLSQAQQAQGRAKGDVAAAIKENERLKMELAVLRESAQQQQLPQHESDLPKIYKELSESRKKQLKEMDERLHSYQDKIHNMSTVITSKDETIIDLTNQLHRLKLDQESERSTLLFSERSRVIMDERVKHMSLWVRSTKDDLMQELAQIQRSFSAIVMHKQNHPPRAPLKQNQAALKQLEQLKEEREELLAELDQAQMCEELANTRLQELEAALTRANESVEELMTSETQAKARQQELEAALTRADTSLDELKLEMAKKEGIAIKHVLKNEGLKQQLATAEAYMVRRMGDVDAERKTVLQFLDMLRQIWRFYQPEEGPRAHYLAFPDVTLPPGLRERVTLAEFDPADHTDDDDDWTDEGSPDDGSAADDDAPGSKRPKK
ncbi:hypothetical protein BC940DRAFT_288361 [Gongronella butleri]|nr:hypothetical protein BC940DRAFT_288361 [Gongronella butleri]